MAPQLTPVYLANRLLVHRQTAEAAEIKEQRKNVACDEQLVCVSFFSLDDFYFFTNTDFLAINEYRPTL